MKIVKTFFSVCLLMGFPIDGFLQSNLAPNGSYENGSANSCSSSTYGNIGGDPSLWTGDIHIYEDMSSASNPFQCDCCHGPRNEIGVQFPKEGNRYIGLNPNNFTDKDVIAIELDQIIGCGKEYEFEFYVARADWRDGPNFGGCDARCPGEDNFKTRVKVGVGNGTNWSDVEKEFVDIMVESTGGLGNWRKVTATFSYGYDPNPGQFVETDDFLTHLIIGAHGRGAASTGVFIDDVSLKQSSSGPIDECLTYHDFLDEVRISGANPINDNTPLRIEGLEQANAVKFRIYQNMWTLVYESPLYECEHGISKTLIWDGRTANGAELAPGQYEIEIKAANRCGVDKQINQNTSLLGESHALVVGYDYNMIGFIGRNKFAKSRFLRDPFYSTFIFGYEVQFRDNWDLIFRVNYNPLSYKQDYIFDHKRTTTKFFQGGYFSLGINYNVLKVNRYKMGIGGLGILQYRAPYFQKSSFWNGGGEMTIAHEFALDDRLFIGSEVGISYMFRRGLRQHPIDPSRGNIYIVENAVHHLSYKTFNIFLKYEF